MRVPFEGSILGRTAAVRGGAAEVFRTVGEKAFSQKRYMICTKSMWPASTARLLKESVFWLMVYIGFVQRSLCEIQQP